MCRLCLAVVKGRARKMPDREKLIANDVTVRERGRWIEDTPFACVCSVCNHERYGLANDSGDNFCPNCGADMRGTEDGNTV